MNFAELNFFLDFPPNWSSAKFESLNMQLRINFKNVIFIACKWCKICKYYVHSMIVLLSPVKKKKKNAFGLKIWFLLLCHNFKFIVIYAFFLPFLYSQNFRVHKQKVLSSLTSILMLVIRGSSDTKSNIQRFWILICPSI